MSAARGSFPAVPRAPRRPLLLAFDGPDEDVRPDRCEARPLLDVVLRFVDLVERIGGHEAVELDDSPFAVTLTALRADPNTFVLGFAPRFGLAGPFATRAGLAAAVTAPVLLEQRDLGPPKVRAASHRLAQALARLPDGVTANLRGAVEAPLSAIVAAEPLPAAEGTETFRAKIVRAGGLSPRVQLKASGRGRALTLEAPPAIAKLAGQTLYAEADVTAHVTRSVDGRVLQGTILELRLLDRGDATAAFDRWYKKVGRPWAATKDIEREVGRGR